MKVKCNKTSNVYSNLNQNITSTGSTVSSSLSAVLRTLHHPQRLSLWWNLLSRRIALRQLRRQFLTDGGNAAAFWHHNLFLCVEVGYSWVEVGGRLLQWFWAWTFLGQLTIIACWASLGGSGWPSCFPPLPSWLQLAQFCPITSLHFLLCHGSLPL